jgi:hypothetical protein
MCVTLLVQAWQVLRASNIRTVFSLGGRWNLQRREASLFHFACLEVVGTQSFP